MPRHLPSLTGLRAYEAAARHLSFKQASEELHVTPAAISQQIRGLEEILGKKLFVRRNRSLCLTETGEAMLPDVSDGFDALARATATAITPKTRSVLKVASAPAFASKWLVGNLSKFTQREHTPDMDVCIFASHDVVDYALEEIDIGIRYGRGNYPGLVSEKLLDDALIPVTSPQRQQAGAISASGDLADVVLLHDDSLAFDRSFPTWSDWLEANAVENVDPSLGPRFNTASDAIAAAIEGTGVLLARRSLVMSDIAAGRLKRLFDMEFPLDHGFHLVYRQGVLERPEVAAFRDWLLEELQ